MLSSAYAHWNRRIFSEGEFLLIQAKLAKTNKDAKAVFETVPFRISKKAKCFKFSHMMRVKEIGL